MFHWNVPLPVNLCFVNSLLYVVSNKVIMNLLGYLQVLGIILKLKI